VKKTYKVRNSLLYRDDGENRIGLGSNPNYIDEMVSESYRKNRLYFHFFFVIYIVSLMLRMAFYIDLRIESSSVENR